mmetsp:Transcript_34538/g.39979  ORF Transcript_34538/g.39979 Transcript_34538/m.39979 type:complete len:98 (+) Transcript_34538:510-803(+)
MDNSDTNAYSTSHLKSPSRVDTMSYLESSPALKRFKISEEEEKRSVINDNFQLGESCLPVSTTPVAIRKSSRKRMKSKILLEAIGELDEDQRYSTLK